MIGSKQVLGLLGAMVLVVTAWTGASAAPDPGSPAAGARTVTYTGTISYIPSRPYVPEGETAMPSGWVIKVPVGGVRPATRTVYLDGSSLRTRFERNFARYDGQRVRATGIIHRNAISVPVFDPAMDVNIPLVYDSLEVLAIRVVREREVTYVGTIRHVDPMPAIGGESDPSGWVLETVSFTPRSGTAAIPSKTLYLTWPGSSPRSSDFSQWEDVDVLVRGVVHRNGLSAGGIETPRRTFDVLEARSIEPMLRNGGGTPAGQPNSLAERIRRDIRANSRPIYPGAQQPTGLEILGGRGRGNVYRCAEHGVRTLVTPLYRGVPPSTYDGIDEVAYYCPTGDHYWVHVSGGFAGFDGWSGPFDLASPATATPTTATPEGERRGLIDALEGSGN